MLLVASVNLALKIVKERHFGENRHERAPESEAFRCSHSSLHLFIRVLEGVTRAPIWLQLVLWDYVYTYARIIHVLIIIFSSLRRNLKIFILLHRLAVPFVIVLRLLGLHHQISIALFSWIANNAYVVNRVEHWVIAERKTLVVHAVKVWTFHRRHRLDSHRLLWHTWNLLVLDLPLHLFDVSWLLDQVSNAFAMVAYGYAALRIL